MNQNHRDEALNVASFSTADPGAQTPPGRRSAIRSFGAAALALVAGARITNVSAAKK